MFDAVLDMLAGGLQQPSLLIFFLLFFLFIIIAYKVVKLLLRAVLIAVIAGMFPVVANLFFGFDIPITIQNIIWFAITGVEIYFVYHILVNIGKLAEFIMKPFGKKRPRKVEKVIIMEKAKDKDEKQKRREKERSED